MIRASRSMNTVHEMSFAIIMQAREQSQLDLNVVLHFEVEQTMIWTVVDG